MDRNVVSGSAESPFLLGTALLPYTPGGRTVNSADSKATKRKGARRARSALLVQQGGSGDVYAQRILLTDGVEEKEPLRTKSEYTVGDGRPSGKRTRVSAMTVQMR